MRPQESRCLSTVQVGPAKELKATTTTAIRVNPTNTTSRDGSAESLRREVTVLLVGGSLRTCANPRRAWMSPRLRGRWERALNRRAPTEPLPRLGKQQLRGSTEQKSEPAYTHVPGSLHISP